MVFGILEPEKVSAFFSFLGRPWQRRVLSSPRRRTVRSHLEFSPNGQPRVTQGRKAANSASLCVAFTCSHQPGRRGSGQAANNDFSFAACAIPARQAAPTPRLGTLRRMGRQGMALHITTNRIEVVIVLDREPLEAALIDVPAPRALPGGMLFCS